MGERKKFSFSEIQASIGKIEIFRFSFSQGLFFLSGRGGVEKGEAFLWSAAFSPFLPPVETVIYGG